MSVKSKKSAAAVDRPFDRETLDRARRIADEYQVIVNFEDGAWYGRGLELPHVMADGKTAAKCVESTREAMVGAVAILLEMGQRPPAPAREGSRSQQVNVRLTSEEKLFLETAARQKGFKGLSDFIRSAALESAR